MVCTNKQGTGYVPINKVQGEPINKVQGEPINKVQSESINKVQGMYQ